MSSLTTYRSLVVPATSDQIQQTIIDLGTNMGILDLSSLIPCTSTSRPPGVQGMTIYQTDNNQIRVYDGTTWQSIWQLGWTTYTASWTASGTAPSVGNGTLSGAYRQSGKSIELRIQLLWGSSTSGGTGRWIFALPVAPKNGISQALTGSIFISGTTGYPVAGFTANDATLFANVFYSDGGTTVGATSPGTFVTGSIFSINAVYEAN